jgi:hypothetical protein
MEIVLEVPEKDVARVLELVKGIKRVKIKSPKPASIAAKTKLLVGLAEAVQGRPWKELYSEVKAEEAA